MLWERRKARKTMEEIERMLDAAMTGSFSETNFDESQLSALETKFAHYLSAAEASSQNIAQEKDKIKTLIADISHQTKTPIANLLLYSELLMEETLPASAKANVEALYKQSEKLRFLIDSLVKLSRLENGIISLSPQPTALQPLLESVVEQYTAKASEKGLSLQMQDTDSMSYRYGGIGYETVLSVDTAQRDSGGAAIPMLYLFDTADDADEAEAEQYLSKLTAGEFSPLMYESKATARSEFAQFRQMFLLVGGILCAIIGLVGLLNFFNAMMTSILSRRREFAVLQAVGMTNRQLKTMLIYEGLFYAMSSVSAAFILSLAVGPLAGKMLGSMFWFFEYRFTILPVLLTIPVFLLLGWLIPCMMYDNAAKCSVVEQLRDAQ